MERYDGPVIDCDVHHEWPTAAHLLPYLSEGWREYVLRPTRGGGPPMAYSTPQVWANPLGSGYRPETYPPGGGAPGSDYDLLCGQLLEPNRIERVVLTFETGGYLGALPNPYLATELARAANDWTIDTWLSRPDDRLRGAMVVATQQPLEAAAEIRRVGGHPRICEVLLVSSGLGKPFGHPAYAPIHEAAAELGLPLAIHAFGEVSPGNNVAPQAAGMPSFYFENQSQSYQTLASHLTSLIAHGVFERYPSLRLLIVEAGVAWVPGVLWKLDDQYRNVRVEVPWLKRWPSEVFHEHVRLTTQPLEGPADASKLVAVLDAYGAEDVLCFSSDYPHWDTDEREHVARTLPRSWHRKVFRDNAAALYGWA